MLVCTAKTVLEKDEENEPTRAYGLLDVANLAWVCRFNHVPRESLS
jgi:hypothetical protein